MFYCEKCRKERDWPKTGRGCPSSYGRCEVCEQGTVACHEMPSHLLPAPKTKNECKSQGKIEQKPHKKPSGNQDEAEKLSEEILELFKAGGVKAMMEVVRSTLRDVHGNMMTHAPPNARLSIVVRMAAVGEKPEVALAITNEEDIETLRKQVTQGEVMMVPRPRDGQREGKKQE